MMPDIKAEHGSEFTARATRILLVDEEANDLRLLRLFLEGQGFDVTACTSHEAGLSCLAAAPFDLVLVSQGSQAFEGRRVLDLAMQIDRHRPVIVVTRCIDMQCYLEAMQMGATDYIEKPIRPSELLRSVRAHAQPPYPRRQSSAA